MTNLITWRMCIPFKRGLLHRTQFVILALVTTMPIMILAITSLMGNVAHLVNPCFTWGAGSGSSFTVSTGRPCSSSIATSQTIPEMLTWLAIIQGGILLGSALGVLGVLRSRPNFLVLSSSIFVLESIPLIFGGAFVLTLLPAVFFMWRAKEASAFRNQAILR
ncbi:MAG TPA: hypothetical protein VGS11_10570 [Candidatus Bathyarchaeia archaeon]|nr:hypothetical protein [Candidatus Bathyarchaeia archaeon]